jgi:hypothetical protein
MSGAPFMQALKDRIAAFPNRYPRLARAGRAAGWALLCGAAFMPGWFTVDLPDWVDLDITWQVGTYSLSLPGLLWGFFWSGALGVALRLSGHASGRRAVGFALLAMFWLELGLRVAYPLVDGNYPFAVPAGFLTASLWVTAAGLLTLPALRTRRAIALLLSAGVGFALLSPELAEQINYIIGGWLFDWVQYVVALWAAVQAAAFAMALPLRAARSGAAAALRD